MVLMVGGCLQSVQQQSPIACKVFFMDGKTKAVSLLPRDTTIEVQEKVARKIGLKSVEGWAMYEVSSHYCFYSPPNPHPHLFCFSH